MTQNSEYFPTGGQPQQPWDTALLERIAIALEQIALELVVRSPVPAATPYPAQPAPINVQQSSWQCPVHGTPAKYVQGGFSERTQRAYSGFWTCNTPYCNERPPRQNGAGAPQQAGVASQSTQPGVMP